MRRVVWCFAVFVLFSSPCTFSLEQIKSYDELAQQLIAGNKVRAIINFDKCVRYPASEKSTSVIGGLNFSEFLQYKIEDGKGNSKEVIATSTNMLINHSKYGYIYNYVRLRVFPDQSAEIFSEILDPQSFSPLEESNYKCIISNGEDKRGLTIFAQ